MRGRAGTAVDYRSRKETQPKSAEDDVEKSSSVIQVPPRARIGMPICPLRDVRVSGCHPDLLFRVFRVENAFMVAFNGCEQDSFHTGGGVATRTSGSGSSNGRLSKLQKYS